MPPPSFWSRLREARLARIVFVYLAGAWGVLQFTSLLREELDLPRWVTPSVLIVLLVGLAVVLIAAWAHARLSQPAEAPGSPRAADEGAAAPEGGVEGERTPEPAEAGPGPLLGSRSRLATLVVAATLGIALLLGAARVVLSLRERGRSLGPGEAVAEAAVPGVAVLPFSVRGEGLDVWREGMVDLISTNLDQVAGLRAIDSRTVLARWREQVGGKDTPDLATSLGVARATHARYALIGSAVSSGRDVRLTADIYQLDPNAAGDAQPKSVWQGQVEGSPDSVLALVDDLSIRILGALLERKGSETPSVSLGSITTRSVPALKAYLQGEALLRGSDFQRAIPEFERAVAADSTFALAYYRLATAQGWLEGLGGEGLENMTRLAAGSVMVRTVCAFYAPRSATSETACLAGSCGYSCAQVRHNLPSASPPAHRRAAPAGWQVRRTGSASGRLLESGTARQEPPALEQPQRTAGRVHQNTRGQRWSSVSAW